MAAIAAVMILLVCAVMLVVAAMDQAFGADVIPREAKLYQRTLKREAQHVWGLQAPVATFAAQIHQESRWRAHAVSPVGARGLAQFMPATAEWMEDVDGSLGGGAAAASNPVWSMRALVTYDLWLWERLAADNDCERMAYVLSSYNGGLGYALRRKHRSARPGVCMGATCTINPGIRASAQAENEAYPRLILLRYEPLYSGWGPGSCS